MKPDRTNLDSRLPTRLRSSLRALWLGVAVVAAYFAGMATMRHRALDAEREAEVLTEAFGEDAVQAAKAKDAIIDLVRTKQVDFCWKHANAEEMAQIPLEKWGEGEYDFGPFHINLREHTYRAYLGYTDEWYDYHGSFVVDGRRWKALPPKLIRARIQHGKADSSADISESTKEHRLTVPE
jgi:hypothetical protein